MPTYLCYFSSSPSYSILWKGKQLPFLTAGRGLRQGDLRTPCPPIWVSCAWRDSSFSKIMRSILNNEMVLKLLIMAPFSVIFDLFYFLQRQTTITVIPNNYNSDSILKILGVFCEASGRIINHQILQMFVSPNVSRSRDQAPRRKCNIPLTTDLGMHLGVPLLLSNKHYQYTIENKQKMLSGWKANYPSLLGGATLVKSATSTIPSTLAKLWLFLYQIVIRLIK